MKTHFFTSMVIAITVLAGIGITLFMAPTCDTKPPGITIVSPEEGATASSCPTEFWATFGNVDEELLFTIVASINNVAIPGDGQVTIDGIPVTITDFALSTQEISFNACNLPAGDATFTVTVGKEGDAVIQTATFTVTVDNRSCKAVIDRGASFGNGLYLIDPDENGDIEPFVVYCDMTTHSGGWTMVLNLDTSDGHVMWWADSLWTNQQAHGTVDTPFVGDHKSPAWMSLSGATQILIVVHEQGSYVGWKDFSKVNGNSMFTHMQGGDNTLIGTSVVASDTLNVWASERLVRASNQLYANHCVQTGGGCTSGSSGSPDGDRIASHESAPSDNHGGGLGNWHDMNFCCPGQNYGSGKTCNGSAFRTTSEAQAGWCPQYNGDPGFFGTDTFGTATCSQNDGGCSGSNWSRANGINYDYAIFLR